MSQWKEHFGNVDITNMDDLSLSQILKVRHHSAYPGFKAEKTREAHNILREHLKRREKMRKRKNDRRKWFCMAVSLILMMAAATLVSAANPTASSPILLKSSHGYPIAPYPMDVNQVIFKDVLEEKTGGRVQLQIFPMGQLFSVKTEISNLALGNIDVTTTPNVYLASIIPAYNIFELPMLFKDEEHILRFYNSESFKNFIEKKWAQKGVKYLGQVHQNYYSIFNTKRPIQKMSDWEGLKMRSGTTQQLFLKAWGASGILMPAVEVVTSLQQGMIDGVIMSPGWVTESKSDAYIKYGSSPFKWIFYHSIPLLMSMKTWDRLPKDIQTIIVTEVIPEQNKRSLSVYQETVQKSFDKAVKAGVQLSWFEPEELDKMMKAAAPIIKEKMSTWEGAEELYKIVEQTR